MIKWKILSARSNEPIRSRGLRPGVRSKKIEVKEEQTSLGAASQEYDFDRIQNNQQIQPRRHVLDVIEVVT